MTGITPGRTLIRRLNRDEYTATIVISSTSTWTSAVPFPWTARAGKASTTRPKPCSCRPSFREIHGSREVCDRFRGEGIQIAAKILVAKPGPGVTADQAARTILKAFLPRAFRRPVDETDIAPYLELFQSARKQGQPFEASILLAFRGALVSPNFLFRTNRPTHDSEVRPLDQYALASRLSYFLWGSMPDEFLFDVAAAANCNDPDVMKELVRRMLRNDRSHGVRPAIHRAVAPHP